jgi:imidazole glycerol-phosphate synthase subunit HisH
MKIAVIDYGIGNVRSIVNAFQNQGANVLLTRDREKILASDGLVLPGVGAFSHGMESLRKYKLVQVIKDYIDSGRPFIGICLGMQMLFDNSEEFGLSSGLGLIAGSVIKLPIKEDNNQKLPHVSWNELKIGEVKWEETILDKVKEGSDMYFVHSFIANPVERSHILSMTEYSGYNLCSTVKKNNIYGCQFHPEKSGKVGLHIIKNFVRMC